MKKIIAALLMTLGLGCADKPKPQVPQQNIICSLHKTIQIKEKSVEFYLSRDFVRQDDYSWSSENNDLFIKITDSPTFHDLKNYTEYRILDFESKNFTILNIEPVKINKKNVNYVGTMDKRNFVSHLIFVDKGVGYLISCGSYKGKNYMAFDDCAKIFSRIVIE